MEKIGIKRVYEDAKDDDGYRILVDCIWPRGVKKEEAQLDDWLKEIAPSTELRKWFGHDPDKFEDFANKYKLELKSKAVDLDKIRDLAKTQKITLLYAAKEKEHNQAVVLLEVLNN